MRHGLEVLGSRLGPSDRSTEFEGKCRHQGLLRVGDDLGTEAATHVRDFQMDAVAIDAERSGDGVAVGVGCLTADPEVEVSVVTGDGDGCTGFQWHGSQTLVTDRGADDDVCPFQHVAVCLGPRLEDDVAPDLGKQQLGVATCSDLRVRSRRQLVVVDPYQVGGIGGCSR